MGAPALGEGAVALMDDTTGMTANETLLLLGVRVRSTSDLSEGAVWMPRHGLLLLDADLSDSAREAYASDLVERLIFPG